MIMVSALSGSGGSIAGERGGGWQREWVHILLGKAYGVVQGLIHSLLPVRHGWIVVRISVWREGGQEGRGEGRLWWGYSSRGSGVF